MVDSVLMLTTAGSIAFAICENWLESWRGEGMVDGVASADRFSFSCPFTPYETTVPIRIPTVRVSKMTAVKPRRLALKRSHKLARASMLNSLQISKPSIIQPQRDGKGRPT